MELLRPIVSGLIGGLVAYILLRTTKAKARPVQGRRYLVYGWGIKVVTALFLPGSLFVAYAASQARPDQRALAVLIALLFVGGALYLAYEVFLVRLSFDEQNIYHDSPLAGHRTIPRAAIEEVGYSHLVQAYYLRAGGYGRVWFSAYMAGFEEFAEYLDRTLHPEESEGDLLAGKGDWDK